MSDAEARQQVVRLVSFARRPAYRRLFYNLLTVSNKAVLPALRCLVSTAAGCLRPQRMTPGLAARRRLKASGCSLVTPGPQSQPSRRMRFATRQISLCGTVDQVLATRPLGRAASIVRDPCQRSIYVGMSSRPESSSFVLLVSLI